jgi:hypothetical protein
VEIDRIVDRISRIKERFGSKMKIIKECIVKYLSVIEKIRRSK